MVVATLRVSKLKPVSDYIDDFIDRNTIPFALGIIVGGMYFNWLVERGDIVLK